MKSRPKTDERRSRPKRGTRGRFHVIGRRIVELPLGGLRWRPGRDTLRANVRSDAPNVRGMLFNPGRYRVPPLCNANRPKV